MHERQDAPAAPPGAPIAIPSPDLSATPLAERDDQRPVPLLFDKALLSSAGVSTATCPQCGLNPAGAPVKRTLEYVPPWVYVGLLLHVFVLFILYLVGRRVVRTSFTLCRDCDRADRRGRNIRSLSVLGAVFAPFVGLFVGLGFGQGAAPGLVLMGIALVAGVVGAVVAHRKTRGDVIDCQHIDKLYVMLKVRPGFREVLAREQPELLRG